MSPQAKVDLGAKAEAMLASWPAPSSDDAAWENRASKIVAAATNAPRADDAQLAALFAKPALDAEPGEMESFNVSAASARSASGVKAMSDSNPGSPGGSSNPSTAPAPAASKRPSLKELAARASQANAAGAPSMRPSTSTPPPPAADAVPQDKQSRPSAPVQSVPPPKASVPPPAVKEDSGRFNLNAMTQAAAAPVVAAEAAKPAAQEVVAEDKPAAANDTSEGAKVKNISEARAKKTKKKSEAAKTNEETKAAEAAPVAETATKKEDEGGGGTKWAIIALLGLAAGGFLYFRNKQQPTPPPVVAVEQKQEAQQVAVDTQKIAEAPKPASTGLSIDALPEVAPSASAKKEAPKAVAQNAEEPAAPPPAPPEPTAAAALPTATAGGNPGDLSSAMANAVGGQKVNVDGATPVADKEPGNRGNQTIPESPAQGSVTGAIRSVTPGAKACVAGAGPEDVSHANLTFSSSGTVSSVSVSGWASSNGKAECIKAAVKGANVGPFAKPTFTVGVPIRP